MDDEDVFISDPKPLNEDFINQFDLDVISTLSLAGESKRTLYISKFENFIIYPSYDGQISLVDLNNNIIIWTYKHTSKITAGTSFGINKIYFVDYDGYLVALSIDGKLEWKSYVGEVFSPPLPTNHGIVIRTSSNNFISLSTTDGSINWKYKIPISPLPTRSWQEITLSDDVIYSGISSGKVIALNAIDGSLKWESTFSPPKGSSDIDRSNDTTSKIIYDDFAIYAISSKGNIAAIAKVDGIILWSRSLSSFIGMDISNDYLIVIHNSGSIYSLNKNTNKVKWRNAELLGRDLSIPTLLDDLFVVSDFEGYLYYIEIKSGLIKARIKVSDGRYLNAIRGNDNDELVLASLEGQLSIIKAKLSDHNPRIKDDEISLIKNNDSERDAEVNTISTKEDSLIDKLIFWD